MLTLETKSKRILDFHEKFVFSFEAQDEKKALNFFKFANAYNEDVFFDNKLSLVEKNNLFLNTWTIEDLTNDFTINDDVKGFLKMMFIFTAREVLMKTVASKDVRGSIFFMQQFSESKSQVVANDNKVLKIEINGVENIEEPGE